MSSIDDAVLDAVAVLRGHPRTVAQLSGGLTNHNYRVTTPHGSWVVRHSPPGASALPIDREQEHLNSVAAAGTGVAPAVVDYLPEHHLLVIDHIDGVTYDEPDVARNLVRIAAACRQLHDGTTFVNDFDMFAIQRSYLQIVQQHGYRLPARYTDHEPQVERIRAALAQHAEPLVPCNNDLLAGNFIDDGEKIWIIDYEYAGNNDACFELGNIASESHLDDDQLAELITAYYGRPLRNKIARATLQGLMSKYGWTLWASIQQATSTIDFDFWTWGMDKYDSAEAIFAGPHFDTLLDDVRRSD